MHYLCNDSRLLLNSTEWHSLRTAGGAAFTFYLKTSEVLEESPLDYVQKVPAKKTKGAEAILCGVPLSRFNKAMRDLLASLRKEFHGQIRHPTVTVDDNLDCRLVFLRPMRDAEYTVYQKWAAKKAAVTANLTKANAQRKIQKEKAELKRLVTQYGWPLPDDPTSPQQEKSSVRPFDAKRRADGFDPYHVCN